MALVRYMRKRSPTGVCSVAVCGRTLQLIYYSTHSGAYRWLIACLCVCVPAVIVCPWFPCTRSFPPQSWRFCWLYFLTPPLRSFRAFCVCGCAFCAFWTFCAFCAFFFSHVFFWTGGTDRGRKAGGRSSHGTGSSGKRETKRDKSSSMVSICDNLSLANLINE